MIGQSIRASLLYIVLILIEFYEGIYCLALRTLFWKYGILSSLSLHMPALYFLLSTRAIRFLGITPVYIANCSELHPTKA
jgi:hypothetical protein